MKNLSITSTIIISATCLTLSAPLFACTTTFSKPALLIDPITGVVEGTTRVVTGLGTGALGVVSGVGRGATGFVTHGWNKPATRSEGQIYRGIYNDTSYRVTESGHQSPGFSHMHKGTGYVITNLDNGRKYQVVQMKTGTMDVMRGNKVTRYQYIQPIVRPL